MHVVVQTKGERDVGEPHDEERSPPSTATVNCLYIKRQKVKMLNIGVGTLGATHD